MFSRSKLPKDLRLRFFESFIASTMHGSSSWVLGATVRRSVNAWAARMLSTITERSVADECRKPSIAVVPRLVKLQVKVGPGI